VQLVELCCGDGLRVKRAADAVTSPKYAWCCRCVIVKHLLFMRRQIHATYDHLLSVAMPPVKRIVNLRVHDECMGLQHPAWLCVLIRCEVMTATLPTAGR